MENPNKNNISKKSKQFELFGSKINTSINSKFTNNLEIKSETLKIWRNKIYDHQSKIVKDNQKKIFSIQLFPKRMA